MVLIILNYRKLQIVLYNIVEDITIFHLNNSHSFEFSFKAVLLSIRTPCQIEFLINPLRKIT